MSQYRFGLLLASEALNNPAVFVRCYRRAYQEGQECLRGWFRGLEVALKQYEKEAAK